MRTLIAAALAAAALTACGGEASTTTPTRATPTQAASRCAIPPRTYDDLAACRGQAEQLELDIADNRAGKTTASVAIPSKDPGEILAAMGAFTREWSTGADSFTLFAFGSADDAAGGGYNRGAVSWNNGGPITVEICTDWMDLDDGGPEVCAEHETFTVQQ